MALSLYAAALLLATSVVAQISDPLQYVDQLVGTQAGGTLQYLKSKMKWQTEMGISR